MKDVIIISSYCLVNSLSKYFEDDKETILFLNDFIDYLKEDPRALCLDMESELELFASEKNLCHICGEDLELIDFPINTVEYNGLDIKENKTAAYCIIHKTIHE